MQRKTLRVLSKGDNAPPLLLMAEERPPRPPISAHFRQREMLEKWRLRIWQTEHKYFMLLHPQFAELVRKLAFSIEKTGLRGMTSRMLFGLLFAWIATGNTKKMEEFIVAVFTGEVFLMNDRRFFLGENPSDLSKEERPYSLLVYNPNRHQGGINVDQAVKATPFFTFLGPSAGPKPWVEEWAAEVADVRRQAAAELGEETVNSLWPSSQTTPDADSGGHKFGGQHQKAEERISYY